MAAMRMFQGNANETNPVSQMLHAVGDWMTAPATESSFVSTGKITPAEFVQAGDYLVHQFPTWSWQSGDAESRRPYLPSEKQYLVARSVPCRVRVAEYNSKAAACDLVGAANSALDLEAGEDGGWLAPRAAEGEQEEAAFQSGSGVQEGRDFHTDVKTTAVGGLAAHVREDYSGNPEPAAPTASPSGEEQAAAAPAPAAAQEAGDDDDDEYADMMDFDADDNLVEEPDTAAVAAAAAGGGGGGDDGFDGLDAGGVVASRTYDVFVTYDKYHQTPRVFFLGYDERGGVLSPESMLEDVWTENARKTVTFEAHPHLPRDPLHGSIHPCRHASAMKAWMDVQPGATEEEVAQHVRRYITVLLKMVQGAIPTIAYDHTQFHARED